MVAERKALREAVSRLQAWDRAAAELSFGEPQADIARARLLEWVRYRNPGYHVGWFHRELCAALQRFSDGVRYQRSPRLIIAAPPRHGKSEITSRRFPVWHMGRNPTHEIILASYNQGLANDMSRDARTARDLALSWWPHLAPGKHSKDGVEEWETQGGGGLLAVGAGAGATGHGAHVFIIDDPFKDAKEADSAVIREGRWKWYTQTAYTRLAPGAGILIMATRWNHDDLTGRALKQFELGEENWEVISFPAIAERDEPYRKAGEPLHPERYSLRELEQKKRVLGSRGWNALYQQRPTPDEGGLFRRAWLSHRYRHDPQRPPEPYTQIVISVDATFTDTETSAYVSIQAWGRIGWIKHHLLDEIHARMDFPAMLAALRDFTRKWSRAVIVIEDKALGWALISTLRAEIPNVIPFSPNAHGNKITRAQHAAPTWEAGCVALPETEWTGDFVEELAAFPLGKYMDRVDSMSQYFLWIAEQRCAGDDEALTQAMAAVLEEGLDEW